MTTLLKKGYRFIKYSWFTTPEKEYLAYHRKRKIKLFEDYFRSNPVKKLQIGAQCNSINDWLNVDILPKEPSVAYMDATETFPFSNDSFDYVFSEHMIEHISLEEGQFMLKECFRILKPGGKIRIATPNLLVVLKVLENPYSQEHSQYIKFYVDRFLEKKYPYDPVYVVNQLFYAFGHKFIHTASSLTRILDNAGFKNIEVCEVGESDDEQFRGIEQHATEIGETNNRIETLVLQAEK